LNCRFAENGIQKASRLLVAMGLVCSMGRCFPRQALGRGLS
jgi:hypothetical protein